MLDSINWSTTGNVATPRVKLAEDGHAVAVWMIEDGTGSRQGDLGQRLYGRRWGAAQQIQDTTLFVNGHYDVTGSDLILKPDGTAVVAWNLSLYHS